LAVAHAAAPDRAAELAALVREQRPHAELELVVSLGAVIGAHAGPGTLALFWFVDDGA
jgi:fatty acid-binding protein DegV